MNFADVVGQENVKQILRRQVDAGRLPHALLLHGPQGAGKLPLALALSRYLLCQNPSGGEPCEECPSCKMSQVWAHPDMHFSFPVIKKKSTDETTSDDYLTQWRELMDGGPYFQPQEWLTKIGTQNQQMQIYVFESDLLRQKLSLRSSQGGRRVILMWLPERMNAECANKLLKLLEEPPSHTHFIMVSQEPEMVLPTIRSRAQHIYVPPIAQQEISDALQSQLGLDAEDADYLAHLAQGNFTAALQQAQDPKGDEGQEFELFVSMMRLAYTRKIKDMTAWSDRVARMGRETQKHLLRYFQRMVRESFVHNFHRQEELNYMTRAESDFAVRFAPFVNERNVAAISDELALCERDIEGNVSARMVFLDLIIKLTLLLKQ